MQFPVPLKQSAQTATTARPNSAVRHRFNSQQPSSRSSPQRHATPQAAPSLAPPIVHEVLRSPGLPLDQATQTLMESRFGQDFQQVRLHTDTKAATSAEAVQALAYTVGSNIVLGSGQYSPQTVSGQQLLAHELAHVVQQRSPTSSIPQSLRISSEAVPEQTAHQAASHITDQALLPVGPSLLAAPAHSLSLQKQEAPAQAGSNPPAPAPTPATLSDGQVVSVEIRDGSGAVTEFSHEYPIDLAGNIEIPTAGTLPARGQTLAQLRQAIHNAFMPNILRNPTVNVALTNKTVNYSRQLSNGDTVHMRVLGGSGEVDPSSGSYTVDAQGQLHLPFVGDITVAGDTLTAVENRIEQGIRSGFILNAVVHLAMTQLNS
ncbi:MAG: DUF4157 domain-containing protein [Leptolyngbya sp. SIO4C5]|nr:DUF4157 domain-containing protein [Leptolyngbya sp. SIO4C5]